jgi:hypothetical protein
MGLAVQLTEHFWFGRSMVSGVPGEIRWDKVHLGVQIWLYFNLREESGGYKRNGWLFYG